MPRQYQSIWSDFIWTQIQVSAIYFYCSILKFIVPIASTVPIRALTAQFTNGLKFYLFTAAQQASSAIFSPSVQHIAGASTVAVQNSSSKPATKSIKKFSFEYPSISFLKTPVSHPGQKSKQGQQVVQSKCIVMLGSKRHCTVCKCTVPPGNDTTHINGRRHQKLLQRWEHLNEFCTASA